jgi:hypothetical protein
MTFVVDTVGEITLPDGTVCQGVILAVPSDAKEEQWKPAMRSAAKLWCERVELAATSDRTAEGGEQ